MENLIWIFLTYILTLTLSKTRFIWIRLEWKKMEWMESESKMDMFILSYGMLSVKIRQGGLVID